MPKLNLSTAPVEQPIPATETPATPAEAAEVAALDVFAEVTTAPAETAEVAASPAADETSELDVFAAFVDDETPEKEYATTSFNISNVKRDGNSIDIILYQSKIKRSMSVYYDQTKKTVTMPYRDGVKMFDALDDGGKVANITTGAEKRTYATLNLTLDDIQTHFSDKLDSLTWEPRTKKRSKSDSDRPSEG